MGAYTIPYADLRLREPLEVFLRPIRKSSGFLPSLMAACSHLGLAPRPAQVSPFGPRYFGATLRPLRLAPRRRPFPTVPPSPPSRASCCFRSCAFSLRILVTSSRNANSASTDIEARRFGLAMATPLQVRICCSPEDINGEARQS